jgi:hypothetical protein
MSSGRIASVAAVVTGASVLTGLSVQLGLVDTSRIRWIHHALYGASLASTATACIEAQREHGRTRPATLAALLALVALPRTRGGTSAHGLVGSIAFGSHAVASMNRRLDQRRALGERVDA